MTRTACPKAILVQADDQDHDEASVDDPPPGAKATREREGEDERMKGSTP
jgi:hypothetical protein